MRMSFRTLGLLIALISLVALIIIWITQLARFRSGDLEESAVPLTEPVTKDISADRGWQNTGILLESGETIHFQFLSGEIRDGEAVIRGPSGVGWACGESDCCEPMPDVQRDALIGRVGDHLFAIGDRSEITVQQLESCSFGLTIVMRDYLIIRAAFKWRFHPSGQIAERLAENAPCRTFARCLS